MSSNGAFQTPWETKDDNEQRAYLTLTTLLPTAYPGYNGIYARVVDYNSGGAMTPWFNFMSTGAYTIPYRTISGSTGQRCYLELSNSNNRAIDVAGRWTP